MVSRTNAAGVHFIRNLPAHVPKVQVDMVAAAFRTIFAHPDPDAMAATWEQVRDQVAGRFPKIGPLMDEAKAEVLGFNAFQRAHWRKICPPTRSNGSTRR